MAAEEPKPTRAGPAGVPRTDPSATAHEVYCAAYVPRAWVAKRLWCMGLRTELLQHAERWEDAATAWAEVERLALVLPLALLRGAAHLEVAQVAAMWVHAALDLGLTERELAGVRVALSLAVSELRPDTDQLSRFRDRAAIYADRLTARTRRPTPRSRLFVAAAATADLGLCRWGRGLNAAIDAEIVGDQLEALVGELAAADQGELFAARVHAGGFIAARLREARAQFGWSQNLDPKALRFEDA